MALGDCEVCQRLLDNISGVATRHLKAVSSLESAVREDRADAQIASLRLHVSACANERREAIDQYRIHLSSHREKAAGAG
jgi:hypothetical protein